MSEEKRPKEVPRSPERSEGPLPLKNVDREGKPEEIKAKPEVKRPKEVPSTPIQNIDREGKEAKPAECVFCNKSIKDQWYYREGKYYCSKGCWKKAKKKASDDKKNADAKK